MKCIEIYFIKLRRQRRAAGQARSDWTDKACVAQPPLWGHRRCRADAVGHAHATTSPEDAGRAGGRRRPAPPSRTENGRCLSSAGKQGRACGTGGFAPSTSQGTAGRKCSVAAGACGFRCLGGITPGAVRFGRSVLPIWSIFGETGSYKMLHLFNPKHSLHEKLAPLFPQTIWWNEFNIRIHLHAKRRANVKFTSPTRKSISCWRSSCFRHSLRRSVSRDGNVGNRPLQQFSINLDRNLPQFSLFERILIDQPIPADRKAL